MWSRARHGEEGAYFETLKGLEVGDEIAPLLCGKSETEGVPGS